MVTKKNNPHQNREAVAVDRRRFLGAGLALGALSMLPGVPALAKGRRGPAASAAGPANRVARVAGQRRLGTLAQSPQLELRRSLGVNKPEGR